MIRTYPKFNIEISGQGNSTFFHVKFPQILYIDLKVNFHRPTDRNLVVWYCIYDDDFQYYFDRNCQYSHHYVKKDCEPETLGLVMLDKDYDPVMISIGTWTGNITLY